MRAEDLLGLCEVTLDPSADGQERPPRRRVEVERGGTVTTETLRGIHYESPSSAAKRTGMASKTLRRRIADGTLRVFRAGPRVIRLRVDDVDALLVELPRTRRR